MELKIPEGLRFGDNPEIAKAIEKTMSENKETSIRFKVHNSIGDSEFTVDVNKYVTSIADYAPSFAVATSYIFDDSKDENLVFTIEANVDGEVYSVQAKKSSNAIVAFLYLLAELIAGYCGTFVSEYEELETMVLNSSTDMPIFPKADVIFIVAGKIVSYPVDSMPDEVSLAEYIQECLGYDYEDERHSVVGVTVKFFGKSKTYSGTIVDEWDDISGQIINWVGDYWQFVNRCKRFYDKSKDAQKRAMGMIRSAVASMMGE